MLLYFQSKQSQYIHYFQNGWYWGIGQQITFCTPLSHFLAVSVEMGKQQRSTEKPFLTKKSSNIRNVF